MTWPVAKDNLGKYPGPLLPSYFLKTCTETDELSRGVQSKYLTPSFSFVLFTLTCKTSAAIPLFTVTLTPTCPDYDQLLQRLPLRSAHTHIRVALGSINLC